MVNRKNLQWWPKMWSKAMKRCCFAKQFLPPVPTRLRKAITRVVFFFTTWHDSDKLESVNWSHDERNDWGRRFFRDFSSRNQRRDYQQASSFFKTPKTIARFPQSRGEWMRRKEMLVVRFGEEMLGEEKKRGEEMEKRR